MFINKSKNLYVEIIKMEYQILRGKEEELTQKANLQHIVLTISSIVGCSGQKEIKMKTQKKG